MVGWGGGGGGQKSDALKKWWGGGDKRSEVIRLGTAIWGSINYLNTFFIRSFLPLHVIKLDDVIVLFEDDDCLVL